MNHALWDGIEAVNTAIGESTGPVNSGNGNQINILDHRSLRRTSTPAPALISEAQRHRLAARFVRPNGFTDACSAITQENNGRTVILAGQPGDGVRSAAIMVLHENSGTGHRFRNLDTDQPSDKESPRLNPEVFQQGDRMLLDMSRMESDQFDTVQRQLESFRTCVAEKDALLAVVLTNRQIGQLDGDLRHLVREPGRASPETVLRSHLSGDEIPFDPGVLERQKDLRNWLPTAPMRSIAELVRLIASARDRRNGRGTFPEWLESALLAVLRSRAEVAARIEARPESRGRAVLLAAALLEGAQMDAAFDAAEKLLRIMESPPEETPILERKGFLHELRGHDIDIDTDRSVRFNELAYDAAVRDYFWDHSPGDRGRLRSWVNSCIRFPVLNREDRERVAQRFAEQCLRVNRPMDLCTEAERWGSSSLRELWEPAAVALLHGWNDPSHGWQIRRRIYNWSRSSDLKPAFGGVLVAVCSKAFEVDFPDQALVRLHHLARHPVRPIALSAGNTLIRHAEDVSVLRQLITRLSSARSKQQRNVDLALFRRLGDQRLLLRHDALGWLLDDGEVRVPAIECWRRLMVETAPEGWSGLAHSWLAEAATAEVRDAPISVLVSAAQAARTESLCTALLDAGRSHRTTAASATSTRARPPT